ncbi:MAG: hypothetical protein Roseis2KO_03030 [Roseivirga sp.]
MKKLYLFTFLLCIQAGVFAQQQIIPCEFTWKAIKLPNGAVADYTSPQTDNQPYQGPCVAFALAATLESQYEIDHNKPNRNLNLSEAFADYAIYNWTTQNILDAFKYNFAIPEEAAGNFARFCDDELNDCQLVTQVRPCIDNNECFTITEYMNSQTLEWEQSVQCVPCPANLKRARGSGVAKINDNINNLNDLKLKLMNDGPMVLKLNNHTLANQFYNFGANSSLAFHAVSVIGWKNAPGGIQLHFKDSWPDHPGYKYSKVLTPQALMQVIQTGETDDLGFEFFQVRNAHVVGEKVPYINFSFFSPADQCPAKVPLAMYPPTIHSLFLNEAVIIRNQYNVVHANLNCNGEAAVDWEWSIPNSGLHPIVKNACDSRLTFYTNTSANSMEIKVRAKASNGLWSPWRSRVFIVTNNRF